MGASSKRGRNLGEKEREFCRNVARGLSLTEAYETTWPGRKFPGQTGAQLAKRPLFRAEIDRIKAKMAEVEAKKDEAAILSILRKRQILAEIAESPVDGVVTKHTDRMGAIALDSKIAGDFAPDKIEHTINEVDIVLRAIRGD